ncbi:MAG: helix-turn-helix domain-containing protein [Treponema sp.]|jgi:AraC family transcriptional regulator|nr:helix-turn-helix domain-containing protein [Treponema sp.]
MLRPYDLLENMLIDIEKGIKNGINLASLSKKYELSDGHLRRLFKFAFRQTITGYIRSRKLTASLDDLLKKDAHIIDIALNYGYGYEQSYIRAFKEEFGILPGEFRKNGQIVKVKPPLFLFDEERLKDGILFGPEIVMVPRFLILGISSIIPFDESIASAPKAAIQFWENKKKYVTNVKNPDVYIGLTYNINKEAGNSEYITSVQVKNFNNIPEGFSKYVFDSCLCARFRYIGKHHYYDLNRRMAGEMYNKIWKFANDSNQKYALLRDKIYFEKIDISCYDGNYCQMEWFAPVIEKE